MDDDVAQVALETVCRHLCHACRGEVLTHMRKNRHAANQRALVAHSKCEQLQLEVAFLRIVNDYLIKQIRKLTARLETTPYLMESMV